MVLKKIYKFIKDLIESYKWKRKMKKLQKKDPFIYK